MVTADDMRPSWAKPGMVGYTPSKLRMARCIVPGDLVKWHPMGGLVQDYAEGEHVGLVLCYLGLRDAVVILTPDGERQHFLLEFIEKSS